ncbi:MULTISPECIES: hypothetical protein, partial [unclassified Streptomyces]
MRSSVLAASCSAWACWARRSARWFAELRLGGGAGGLPAELGDAELRLGGLLLRLGGVAAGGDGLGLGPG